MFEWMAWTMPVAVFFTCIVAHARRHDGLGAALADGAAQGLPADGDDARRPPLHRPAGRRLLNLAFVGFSERMVVWFGLEQEPSVWIGFVVSMLVLALIMRKG